MTPHEADKKKLLKRLKTFCSMLGDDLSVIEPKLLTKLEETIRRLGSATKVVVAGMSDSGHHALSEFFLGTALFENDAEAAICPTIQVRFGETAQTRSIMGRERRLLEGSSISEALATGQPDAIGLELPNPIASQIGFTILPAYDGDGDRTKYLVDLLKNTEIVVWCSEASRPWLPQERRLWFTVPDLLKDRSVIALTGADLVSDETKTAIFEEKCDVVADEFRTIAPIAIDVAKRAAPNGTVVDADMFVTSGGQEILKSLMTLVQAVQTDLIGQARALMKELDKIPLGGAQPAPTLPTEAAPDEATAKAQAGTTDLRAYILACATTCNAAVNAVADDEMGPVFESMKSLLAGLLPALDESPLDTDHDLIRMQVDGAIEMVGLLSYEDNARAAHEAAAVVRQICFDILSRINETDDKPFLLEIEQSSEAR